MKTILKLTKEIYSIFKEKYGLTEQEYFNRLEGLKYSSGTKYWDYIRLETLLSIQQPKTDFSDEIIFIIYHQITELYFKLILNELHNITTSNNFCENDFYIKIKRLLVYYEQMIGSFTIVSEGINQEEFLKFRTTLYPASGYQSYQYRLIELSFTDAINLLSKNERNCDIKSRSTDEIYNLLYWRMGANLNDEKKNLSLIDFEEKYNKLLINNMQSLSTNNLWQYYVKNISNISKLEDIKDVLKKIDVAANINWPLAHYKSVIKKLVTKDAHNNSSTGGLIWQKYLPPHFQKIIYFPDLWSYDEKNDWGKSFLISKNFF